MRSGHASFAINKKDLRVLPERSSRVGIDRNLSAAGLVWIFTNVLSTDIPRPPRNPVDVTIRDAFWLPLIRLGPAQTRYRAD